MYKTTLRTYITAIFGEDCERHFCKLNRLCELRTLADKLFNELCEEFITQVRLRKKKETTVNLITVNIMTKWSYNIFPMNNIEITLESSKLWIIESTASLHSILNVILKRKW